MKRQIILLFLVLGMAPAALAHAQNTQNAPNTQTASGPACHDAAVPEVGSLPPPPLLDGIGNASLQVSCSPQAQRYFDQGLNLLHCFWDFESVRAFREAVRLDPSCAMGWWGIWRSLQYNAREEGSEREAALDRAVALSGKATEHERFYLRAAAALDPHDKTGKPDKTRPQAEKRAGFIHEMEALIDLYPGDLQAQILLADFLRQGYEPADGRPKDGQLYSQAILRNILAAHPDNAAAHHYWIHAVENSSRPEDGLASSIVLPALAPRCGHVAHMPGHIYYRIGEYAKARDAFLASREIDLAYMKEQGIAVVNDWNYVHNLDYLVGSCAEDGRYQEGLRWADELARIPVDPARAKSLGLGFILYGGQTARARLQMRYGLWDEAARSLEGVVAQAPPADASLARDYQSGMLAYARGMAAAVQGDAAALRTQTDALDALNQKLSGKTIAVGSDWYFGTAAKILAVNLLELRGALDSLEGRHDQAITRLREAADRERDLGYWEPPHYTRPVVETLAWACERAGRWKEARDAWQASLKLRPRNGHALYGLARAWAAEGNREESARAYAEFLTAWKDADRSLILPAPVPAARAAR
jgi:tetratricopeptide (TPR) repeat protein